MMDFSRRTWLAWLAAGSIMPFALIVEAAAQNGPKHVVEIRIEGRKVVAPVDTITITEGDLVELRWTSDEQVELHLHGYDLELTVLPNEPGVIAFEAFASGRFPITSHGWGKGGHSHDALTYLEIHPK